jgi:uncharacterized membrane protein
MRKFLFWLMPAVYIITGINHFSNPGFYLALMPEWLPQHELANYAGGIAEIILAIGLIPVQTRKISAWLIIAMLVIFFFAIHIPAVINFYGKNTTWFWISIIRLPIQFYLVWWAFKYTKNKKEKIPSIPSV